nr:uncharacterized protein LOC118080122 [Zootoca vivipara]
MSIRARKAKKTKPDLSLRREAAMAVSGDPVRDLCEEATCSICLGYFKDPVIIHECGHNFCRSCLIQCWEKSEGQASCPQCRETVEQSSIRKNQQLANFVEIIKKFSHLVGKKEAEGKGRMCEKHQEPLKLFCKEDGSPICVVCDRSKEHKSHEVIPLEEASQEFKDQINSCLDNVRKKRERIIVLKADTEKESQDLLKQTDAEREKMVAEFRQMHQFLEEQEKLLLSQMAEVEKEIAAKREEHLARLSGELSSLDSLIWEMEEKLQEPASELLQDIGTFLHRSQAKENLENPPVAFPPALKWRIWDFCDIHPFLEGVMKKFRDTVEYGLQLQKENVTLDPDTAHPILILSEDQKSVREGEVCQDLPDNPERFDTHGNVLGCEEFKEGRHFWEVTVGREEGWEVGVARKSLKRKGELDFDTMEGIWGLGKWDGGYRLCCPYEDLVPSEEPKRIRVTLNCEGERVSFYDADTAALLHAYPAASFSGETLQPYFYVTDKGNLKKMQLWTCLILFEDQESIRDGDVDQNLPNNPERFDTLVSMCWGMKGSQRADISGGSLQGRENETSSLPGVSAMAAVRSPIRDLCEEATCSICLEYFRDPVIIPECGHNFCRSCLIQCWEKSEGEASCLQCRETVEQSSIRRNQQLANIVEIAKKFSHFGAKEEREGKGEMCEKHQEPLELFCKEDRSPICVLCDVSKEHKSHEVIPLEEASQEYKDQISSCLDIVRKEREKILVFKEDTEKESQELLKQTDAEREKTVAEFRQLHQFLEEQEKRILAQMAEAEKEIAAKRDEHLARLSRELSSLDSLIWEMEEKLQEPASEILQDFGSFLQRSQAKQKFKNLPMAFPPALKWRIWDFCDINLFLEAVMKKFRDTVEYELQLRKENVTLDPDTAHPCLILSKDRKSVRWGGKPQDLPDNPERFDTYGDVLGCEAFKEGRHFWEVTVGREEEWSVGVARKSVKRKGTFTAAPEEGIWGMEKCDCYPNNAPVPSEEPKRIRVTLNCEGGRVSFYDADTATLLHSFSEASFSGEILQPYFYVMEKANLTLS